MDNTVKLYMNNAERCKIVMGQGTFEKSVLSSTALQRPDVQKTRLAYMMRCALRQQLSRKKQKTYWKAFMASYTGQGANSNDRI